MSAVIIRLPGAGPAIPTKKNARKSKARAHRTRLLAEATERAKASGDPIFAAIEAHLAAVVMKQNHTDDTSGMTLVEEKADEAYSSLLADLCDEALRTVLGTSPTTWEGVAALLEHVGRDEFLDPADKEQASLRETFLSSFNECCDARKRYGQDFPLRLAKAIRTMIGGTPSAA
jgi:hypothetical protein